MFETRPNLIGESQRSARATSQRHHPARCGTIAAVSGDRGRAVRELLGLEHGDGVAIGVLEPG